MIIHNANHQLTAILAFFLIYFFTYLDKHKFNDILGPNVNMIKIILTNSVQGRNLVRFTAPEKQ